MIRPAHMIAAAAFAFAASAPAQAMSLADALSQGLRNAGTAETNQPAAAPTAAPATAAAEVASETDGGKPWVCRVHYNHAHCRYFRPRYYYYTYTYVTRVRYW